MKNLYKLLLLGIVIFSSLYVFQQFLYMDEIQRNRAHASKTTFRQHKNVTVKNTLSMTIDTAYVLGLDDINYFDVVHSGCLAVPIKYTSYEGKPLSQEDISLSIGKNTFKEGCGAYMFDGEHAYFDIPYSENMKPILHIKPGGAFQTKDITIALTDIEQKKQFLQMIQKKNDEWLIEASAELSGLVTSNETAEASLYSFFLTQPTTEAYNQTVKDYDLFYKKVKTIERRYLDDAYLLTYNTDKTRESFDDDYLYLKKAITSLKETTKIYKDTLYDARGSKNIPNVLLSSDIPDAEDDFISAYNKLNDHLSYIYNDNSDN